MKLEDFRYFTLGEHPSAPWIVFLHGVLGSAGNWRRITPGFVGEYRVLTFDQRGHGQSFKPESGYEPKDFAVDLNFLMEELKIEKASIVGHSMGGRNAMVFASLYPEKINKLVVEDIGPESPVGEGNLVKQLRSIPVPFPSKVKAKEYLLNNLGDPRLGNFFYTNMKVSASGEMTWGFNLERVIDAIVKGRFSDPWPLMKSIQCPTLFIRGEKSEALSQVQFERVLKSNPLFKGAVIAGAGHWVHADKPDEFIKVVKEFIGE